MKCLVTGATGFVGANLVRALLQRSNEVYIIARESSDDWRISHIQDSLTILYGDLTDRDGVFDLVAMIRPDIIFHVATYGGFPLQLNKEMMIGTNLIGTMNLLDAAVKYDVGQFINTGSSSEYGLKNEPMRENDICQPVNFYGVTKLAATTYCTMIGETLQYPVCTLRLFSPYGEFEDSSRLYPCIKKALISGQRPRLSQPDCVRDFISIQKVCQIYLKMAEAKYPPGAIINVGSGRQQTIREFYAKIAYSMGISLEPIWGEAPPRTVEPRRWEADISKLKSLIGIEFEQDDVLCR